MSKADTTTTTESAPPEERFWKRYSPHQELPLASAASVVLHGLALVCILLAGMALAFRWHDEASQPPQLEVGFVEAPGGDGGGPNGGTPGTPGQPTEAVSPVEPKTPAFTASVPLPSVSPFKVAPPENEDPLPPLPTVDAKSQAEAVANAARQIQEKVNAANAAAAAANVKPGAGGTGGSSTGPGTGGGEPGIGPGGVGGPRSASKAEIRSRRWSFNLLGSPKEVVEKQILIGVTSGFTTPNGDLWLIKDLKRRPVEVHRENPEKFKDAVQWFNRLPSSIGPLARELGLPPPPQFVMLLPKDREQKMADAEMAFTQDRGRDISKVQKTWFDFRIRGGMVEPVVIGQEPFDNAILGAFAAPRP